MDKPKQKVVVLGKDNVTDIKIVLIGNSGTGKTSFSSRWIKNEFNDFYKATIMSEFNFKVINHNSKDYKIQLWDISGQDKNIQLTRVFAKNAQGCLIMTDIMNPSTLESSIKWKEELDNSCQFLDGNKLPCLLIQNKIDLVEKEESLNNEKIKNFAQEHGYINVFNVSAKTGIGVEESMDYLITNIIERLDKLIKKSGGIITKDRKSMIVQVIKPKNESLFQKKTCDC